MALIEKSLTFLTLGAMAIALAGCPGATTETGEDSGKVEDTSPVETGDSTPAAETGSAIFAWYMAGNTDGTTWGGGAFGSLWVGIYTATDVCDVIGDLADAGSPSAPGCPGCAWSFNLLASNSVATGDECEDLASFGASPTYDGEWDGFNYSIGWADSFDFYGDASLYTEETITLYYEGSWIPFMFNFYPYAADISGDSSSFESVSYRTTYYYYYL